MSNLRFWIVLITENQDRCFGSNSEIVLYEIPSPISYHLNSKPEVSNKYQVACRNLQPIFIQYITTFRVICCCKPLVVNRGNLHTCNGLHKIYHKPISDLGSITLKCNALNYNYIKFFPLQFLKISFNIIFALGKKWMVHLVLFQIQ